MNKIETDLGKNFLKPIRRLNETAYLAVHPRAAKKFAKALFLRGLLFPGMNILNEIVFDKVNSHGNSKDVYLFNKIWFHISSVGSVAYLAEHPLY